MSHSSLPPTLVEAALVEKINQSLTLSPKKLLLPKTNLFFSRVNFAIVTYKIYNWGLFFFLFDFIFRPKMTRPWKVSASELTDNIQVANLVAHWLRVDLTHVPPSVLLVDVVNVEGPGRLIVLDDGEPGDPRHDRLVDRQQHLAVHVEPRHLQDTTA